MFQMHMNNNLQETVHNQLATFLVPIGQDADQNVSWYIWIEAHGRSIHFGSACVVRFVSVKGRNDVKSGTSTSSPAKHSKLRVHEPPERHTGVA